MKPFFNVQTLPAVHKLAQCVPALGYEEVGLARAAGRTLAGPLAAPANLPGFNRATMDGYAVMARDTFGAGETSPAYLDLVGEVRMGRPPEFGLAPGQCAAIGTGGMLPAGANAVVMVEHTRRPDETLVEVAQSVAPGQHMLAANEDAVAGEVLLPAGQVLRPQDLGLAASLGFSRLLVVRRPRVGIISTGDEVVPVETEPAPGQVRDVNTHTISAQAAALEAEPVAHGLVRDDPEALRQMVARSLETCDLTLLSGGSSVGARDHTVEVFQSFPQARLLVHGVSVAPGKPFIWVETQGRHLLGLPGQVASCMVAFHLFVEPILERMHGRPARGFTRFGRQMARLARNLPSRPGREEYLRVRLSQEDGQTLAHPVLGKSGLIKTLTQAHGLVRVGLNAEGVDAGETVEVLLFP